jgi:hypothetical protein
LAAVLEPQRLKSVSRLLQYRNTLKISNCFSLPVGVVVAWKWAKVVGHEWPINRFPVRLSACDWRCARMEINSRDMLLTVLQTTIVFASPKSGKTSFEELFDK